MPNVDLCGKYIQNNEPRTNKNEPKKRTKIINNPISKLQIVTQSATYRPYCVTFLRNGSDRRDLSLLLMLKRMNL